MDCLIICRKSLWRGRINQRRNSSRIRRARGGRGGTWLGLKVWQRVASQEGKQRAWVPAEGRARVDLESWYQKLPGWPRPLRPDSQSGCSQEVSAFCAASPVHALNQKSTWASESHLKYYYRLWSSYLTWLLLYLRLITTLVSVFVTQSLWLTMTAYKMMETDSSSWLHSGIARFPKSQCWGPTSRDFDLFDVCAGTWTSVGHNIQVSLIFNNMWNMDLSKHTT